MRERASFPAELRSAAAARRHAEVVLAAWGLDETREVVRLLVSELVVNAVLHAGSPAELTIRRLPGCIRVEVSDTSPERPAMREHSPTAPNGRGLLILDDLAQRWGVDVSAAGKTVWFELDVGTDGE